jgi:hypothetical protein
MKITQDKLVFNNVSELGDYVSKLEAMPRAKNMSVNARGYDWDFGMDYKSALDLAVTGGGWARGAADISAMELPEINHTQDDCAPALEMSVVGFAPVVPAMLAGAPDCMMALETVEMPRKIISIGVNLAISSKVNARELFNRGRALLAAIDALQTQGYEVELWGVDRTKIDLRSYFDLQVCVKAAGEFYDAGKVAFALCSAAINRRLVFKMLESHERYYTCTCSQSYGQADDIPKGDFDVYFPVLNPKHYRSPEAASDIVFKTIYMQLNNKK